MAKDPAVLFYYQDFLVGTALYDDAETGCYIRCLCHLFDKDSLPEKDMIKICGTQEKWKSIRSKFERDPDGTFFNRRAREEKEKRLNYSESRRNNRLRKDHMNNISNTYVHHMENENINENINVIKKEKVISSVPEITMQEVESYFESCGFPKTEAQNFFSYYSSQNWETKGGASIKSKWQNKVIQWMNQQKQFSKPTIPDHKNNHPSTKTKCDYCGGHAGLWIDGFAACNYDHYQKAKQKGKKK